MMQMRDWISGLIGAVVALIGLSSFLTSLSFLSFLSDPVVRWIAIVAGIYLLWNSIVEVTNSNILGWYSLGTAAICVILAILPTLPWGINPFPKSIYSVMLVAEGALLMVATFAMEL